MLFASIISNNKEYRYEGTGNHYYCHVSIPTIVFSAYGMNVADSGYALIKESIGISDHYPDFCGNQCCGSDHSFPRSDFSDFLKVSERRF